MKLVHAYIQPHKLQDVTTALRPLSAFTVMEVRGRGRGKQLAEKGRASESARDFEKHVKIEACCPDAAVDQIVEAIRSAAHTGLAGDGLILVTPTGNAVRIRTGEQGDEAC